MDELLNYLRLFATLSDSDAGCLGHHVREVSLARDDYFLDVNEIPGTIGFVKCGVLRAGCYDSRGATVVKRFIEEGHFISDAYRLGGRPSQEFVQAVTDSRLLTLSAESVSLMPALIDGWDVLMARVALTILRERQNWGHSWIGVDATSRYLAFDRIHPGLTDRIGLGNVASCLGMSASTLSRIRTSQRQCSTINYPHNTGG